jgi:hypothetical protein
VSECDVHGSEALGNAGQSESKVQALRSGRMVCQENVESVKTMRDCALQSGDVRWKGQG